MQYTACSIHYLENHKVNEIYAFSVIFVIGILSPPGLIKLKSKIVYSSLIF